MPDPRDTQYVPEEQIWFVGVATGFIVAGFAGSAFFAFWALQALGFATDVSQMGITGVGATLLVSAIVTRAIVGRLWGYAVVTFASLGTMFGPFFQNIDELERDDSEEFCHDGNWFFALSVIGFGLLFLSFFYMTRWTCGTANPDGGFTHGTCTQFEPGPYHSLVLTVIRFMGGAFGVSGLSLLLVGFLELRFLWRGSSAQERYRSSSLYFWLHPRAALRRDLDENEQDG